MKSVKKNSSIRLRPCVQLRGFTYVESITSRPHSPANFLCSQLHIISTQRRTIDLERITGRPRSESSGHRPYGPRLLFTQPPRDRKHRCSPVELRSILQINCIESIQPGGILKLIISHHWLKTSRMLTNGGSERRSARSGKNLAGCRKTRKYRSLWSRLGFGTPCSQRLTEP